MLVLVLLAPASLLFAISVGSVEISWAAMWQVMSGNDTGINSSLILELRLPRALSAFLTGAMLALAGGLMQVLLRNPLADPYILGVSGGAAVATLLGMLLGLSHFWLAYTGMFKGDMLIVQQVKRYICDGNAMVQRYDILPRHEFPFPKELQEIHEKKRDAFTLAAGDLATKIQRLEESGIDPLAAKIDQQFQISVPLACTIFAFVGFFFSIYNPRKEISVGVLYAILIAFIYYVFMAIIRSLAKQDQEILRNPYIAAWLTNVFFFIFGIFLFTKVRR